MPGSGDDIQAALRGVEEPELRRSVVELGMVKGVAVDGRTAVVALALPLAGRGRPHRAHAAGWCWRQDRSRASTGSTSTCVT